MKLIGYLFKKIIPLFLGTLVFFSLVLNLVDLFMHIANYLQNECSVLDVFKVMWLYVPKTIWYAVPIAMLFSTSYVLSDMYANNELEALFASGVSLFRFTAPVLILSFLMSIGLFWFENKFVVSTFEKKTTLQNTLLKTTKTENNTDVIVLSKNGTIIYKANKYIESSKRLQNAYFLFRDEDKKFQSLIYANVALWNSDKERWLLQDAVQYEAVDNTIKIVPVSEKYTSQLTESYDIFRKNVVDIQAVNANDAKVYVNHLKKAGLPYQEQLAEYYKKFSFPFIIFIVVFLSIGLTGKTKKNVLLISLASCISASVLFYVLLMVTMVLAKHGYISPFMGAWAPGIFFTIGAGVLLKYSRT